MDITYVNRTKNPLTERENQVAQLVADGLRNEEIGERLGMRAQTVKSHLKTIFDKWGVRNRVELTRVVLGFPVVASRTGLTAAESAALGREDKREVLP